MESMTVKEFRKLGNICESNEEIQGGPKNGPFLKVYNLWM